MKAQTAVYTECRKPDDTAIHAIFECGRWAADRRKSIANADVNLTADGTEKGML